MARGVKSGTLRELGPGTMIARQCTSRRNRTYPCFSFTTCQCSTTMTLFTAQIAESSRAETKQARTARALRSRNAGMARGGNLQCSTCGSHAWIFGMGDEQRLKALSQRSYRPGPRQHSRTTLGWPSQQAAGPSQAPRCPRPNILGAFPLIDRAPRTHRQFAIYHNPDPASRWHRRHHPRNPPTHRYKRSVLQSCPKDEYAPAFYHDTGIIRFVSW